MERKNISSFVSIILIACCLRGPITGVGPLVTTLQAELGISATVAGLLTTIPVLAFALVSFFTDKLARKFGVGPLMLASLIVMAAGLLIRSFLGVWGLFAGTVIIGLGIGIDNVLLPAVTKTRYPEKMGTVTGTYTTFMAGLASVSAGITVPLSLVIGWRLALLIWIILIVAAGISWIPQLDIKLEDKLANDPTSKKRHVATSSVTWFITLYMGLTSLMFYFTVAWFSTILQSHGYPPVTAGLYNMIMMLCGLPGSFLMPIIASKTKHQGFWGAFIGLLFVIGMVTLMFADITFCLVITIITLGFSTGGAIAFIMVLFPLHTHDAEDASSLSAFAQGAGYIIAAIGPVLVGRLYDASGNWTVPLIVLTGIAVASVIFGILSGRDRLVETKIKQ